MDQLDDTLKIFVAPSEIFNVKELNPYDKLIYLILRACINNQSNKASLSYETIAKKASIKRIEALASIKKLEKLKLIKKSEQNLYIIYRPSEVLDSEFQNSGDELSEKNPSNFLEELSEINSNNKNLQIEKNLNTLILEVVESIYIRREIQINKSTIIAVTEAIESECIHKLSKVDLFQYIEKKLLHTYKVYLENNMH